MSLRFPGFCDLQVNGFAGVDFNTPGASVEQIGLALAAMRATGVTRCLPTLITAPFDRYAACARALVACEEAAIAGLHLEGPYISPEDGVRGAHPRAAVLAPSIEDFCRRQDAAEGSIRLVTLAPEMPGALALIEYLVGRGLRVAIGHTAATGAEIRDAIRAGATLSTHLGNGCPQLMHRHDNVIWEQLAADELTAGVIVDGHHLPPAVVKSFLRAKGPGRVILVTDAMAAAAAPPGRYRIGWLEVEVGADGCVRQPGAPNLAGSALTMDAAVGNTARFGGLAIEAVLPLASSAPARYLGIEPAGEVTAEWDPAACRLTIREVREGALPA